MVRYSKQQQAACLSNLSNLLFKAKRPFHELQEILSTGTQTVLADSRVQELIGEWKIVWGPVVHSVEFDPSKKTDKRQIPDNVCFVAKTNQNGTPIYLIAIAGTNSKSLREDICNQDLRVRPKNMEDWKKVTGNESVKGKIALGTRMGLTTVLNNLIDHQKSSSLKDWIIAHPFEDGSELITAGHSLGAALSSTLAVWLADTRQVWEGSNICISTYPTAGPTPGDKNWAEHAMETLQGRFYGTYNSLDAVPRAWDRIDTVKSLYEPFGLKPKLPIKTGLRALVALVGKDNPYHRCSGWTMFEGKFNPNAPGKPRAPFMNQIMYQHLLAYIEPMGYQDYFRLQEEIYPRPEDKK